MRCPSRTSKAVAASTSVVLCGARVFLSPYASCSPQLVDGKTYSSGVRKGTGQRQVAHEPWCEKTRAARTLLPTVDDEESLDSLEKEGHKHSKDLARRSPSSVSNRMLSRKLTEEELLHGNQQRIGKEVFPVSLQGR
jgi:hypothetical protein